MLIEAHGIRVDLPTGWEGRIYRRPHGDPTLHAGDFRLPEEDGDFGSYATEIMPPGSAFLVLTEYRPGAGLEPGRGLFAPSAPPLPLEPAHFLPNALLVARRGRSGLQHFFTQNGRPFCLYAVLRAPHGAHAAGAAQVGGLERVVRSLDIAPVTS